MQTQITNGIMITDYLPNARQPFIILPWSAVELAYCRCSQRLSVYSVPAASRGTVDGGAQKTSMSLFAWIYY